MPPSGASRSSSKSPPSRCGRRLACPVRITPACSATCAPSAATTDMKIPVNLASQPFRRYRPILVGSVLVALLLSATLGVLIFLITVDRAQSADVRLDLARLDTAIRQTTAQQSALEAVLRKPENAQVLER